MISAIWNFLSTEGFQPHGLCLLWRSDVFWTHLISDAIIVLSYFSIPVALIYLARRRRDLMYGWVLYLFSAFIVGCGITHIFGIWTMFVPDYGLEAIAMAFTAAVSLAAAVSLWPLMPRLIAVPSSQMLEERNSCLAREIASRQAVEARLREVNDQLELRVSERTERLEQINLELETARHLADQSNRTKSEFLAAMSHEIRTPMNGVLGVLDLVKMGVEPEEREKLLDVARESAKGLLAVINDILDYSRLEAGAVRLEQRCFNPRLITTQVADLLRECATRKGIRLRANGVDSLPSVVLGDSNRLTQVLMNLVGNAIKFTEAGEVLISAKHVTSDQGYELRVAVSDTGIGIDPTALSRLFSRFTQADASMTRRYGGTGLGLAISRELVRLMGGTLEVESSLGLGSIFSFSIACGIPKGGLNREQEHAIGAADLPRLNVLVAEDNSVNELIIRSFLVGNGHNVTIVENGHQVVSALEANSFDLVLMDISMPELDGVDATRQIRRTSLGFKDIPIVALTANAMEGDREAFLAAGMDDYVSKPISRTALFEAMRCALGRNRTRRKCLGSR